MIKKTINYTDYNGKERTEEHWFNLNKGEILEMEMSQNGGLEDYVQQIVEAEDGKKITALFKELILKSYGQRTPDGRGFAKSDEATAEFRNSLAFSELYVELATDAVKGAEFVNGIIPLTPEQQAQVMKEVGSIAQFPTTQE